MRSVLGALAFWATAVLAVDLDLAPSSCTLKAAGAGKDDAPGFLAAVKHCSTTVIPVGTTLNISTKMDLTGFANKHINLQGTLSWNPDINHWAGNSFYFPFQNSSTFWLLGGKNVLLDGGGTLNGNGQVWYDEHKVNETSVRPILLTVHSANGVVVRNISLVNSPMWAILVNESKNVTFDGIDISAKSTSSAGAKNSDGWDIYRSDQVTIKNSIINNGDDCVSFKPNSTNVLVSNLNCTGSHGISVGSLGQYAGVYDIVQNITAENIIMTNASDGARIKAWAGPSVGAGIVKNITFIGFFETNVGNPIVIDQCYFTSAADCAAYPSNTYIQDVRFINITGTGSKTALASLNCSPGARCSNVSVDGLSLTGPAGDASTYKCQNVALTGSSASLFGACASTG